MTRHSMSSCVRNRWILGAGIATVVLLFAPSVDAQAQNSDTRPSETRYAAERTETFVLKNNTQMSDLNDEQTALRNVLYRAKIYGLASQNMIVIRGTEEELQDAHRLLAELDRPKKLYRVTYTVSESENGKRTGAQHYSLVVADDRKATLKQGSRVPIVTGTVPGEDTKTVPGSTQVQYLDVGLNIEATIRGVSLRTKVEESSVAPEKSNVGIQDPIVQQTMLEGAPTFVPGKPLTLGSIDMPGSARHQDIEVVVELLP